MTDTAAIRALLREALDRLDKLEQRAAPEPTAAIVLSTPQAARRAGVTTKTIRRWIAAGKLPAAKVGGYHRIRARDLDAYLSGETGTPEAEAGSEDALRWAERMLGGNG